eukprot:6950554-Prymnesium_polylepis.1
MARRSGALVPMRARVSASANSRSRSAASSVGLLVEAAVAAIVHVRGFNPFAGLADGRCCRQRRYRATTRAP